MDKNSKLINKYESILTQLSEAFDDPFTWNVKAAKILEEAFKKKDEELTFFKDKVVYYKQLFKDLNKTN